MPNTPCSQSYHNNTMNVVTKTIVNFSALIVLVILSYCSSPSSFEEEDRFAIYLLENESLTTKDVEDVEISKVVLKSIPVISYNDIVGYRVENHKVYLNEKLPYYFGEDSLKIFSQIFGKPFVLIAKGTRIYLGSFVTGLSSWVPNTPQILDYAVSNIEKSFIISGAPIYHKSDYVDRRNDVRILQALSDKIIQ